MKVLRNAAIVFSLGGALLAAVAVLTADGTTFSDFTPLTASTGPMADESTPIVFGNPVFQQRILASRNVQLAAGAAAFTDWDMITGNETGPHKGRYVFTVYE